MNHSKTVAATAVLCLSTGFGAQAEERFDYAHVVSASPIYEQVVRATPKEHCWIETIREERPSRTKGSATPALVGGIIGGVLGNEVGRGGDNKKIGAVVGSILGMSIAKDISRKSHSNDSSRVTYKDVERCEITQQRQTYRELSGYEVEYAYHGHNYTTFMREHPGDQLRVAIDVRPLSN